jgi:hypothetical protein
MIIRLKGLMPMVGQIYNGETAMAQYTAMIRILPNIIRPTVLLDVIHSVNKLNIARRDASVITDPG